MPVSQEELTKMLDEADHKITLEQIESGLSQEDFDRKERSKYRWSGSATRGMWLTASDLAGDFNAGITSLLGPEIQDVLANMGAFSIGRPSDTPPRMGITGAGAETAGQAMTLAGGMAGMLTKETAKTGFKLLANEANPSIAGRIGRDLMETVQKFPKSFFAAEAAGGMGAGMAMKGAELGGGSPNEQAIAGLAGGFAGGGLPIIGSNFTRQAMNWGLMKVAPWLDGGETLAATRLQRLAADPRDAARKIKASRDGVSPARAADDKNLLALEGRIFADNPTMAAEFEQSLQQARMLAQRELRDHIGEMRQPGEWERAVIEQVAAPGTVITLTDPQSMLKQAQKSFRPLYDEFAGYPVKPEIETGTAKITLEQALKMNVTDDTVLASDKERKIAQTILTDELSRLRPSGLEEQPTLDSAHLLLVRQNLRDKISKLTASRTRANHITARLLSNGESAITLMLQQQLPDGAMGILSQIDNNYNVYRIVEQAVFTAGDKKLSAEALGGAIKAMDPNTAGPLRAMARAGRDVESVLGDPRAASLMVKGQPKGERQQLQRDFFGSLWRRSMTKELASDNTPFVSGERFLSHLVEHKATAKALGVDDASLTRAMDIARQIKAMEAKSPAALREMLEEGPTTVLQLAATLVGAKSGQRLSSAGIGSDLVMAQFASKVARRRLALLFQGTGEGILIKAASNKKLYAALLTKSTASEREQVRAARVIAAWLEPTTEEAFDDDYGSGGR